MAKKKRGRPQKRDKDRRDKNQLRIPLTLDEREAIDTAAEVDGSQTTPWARDVLLKAAKKRQKRT